MSLHQSKLQGDSYPFFSEGSVRINQGEGGAAHWECRLPEGTHIKLLLENFGLGKGYTLRMFKSYQLLSCIIMLQVWGKLELIISTRPSLALLLTRLSQHIDLCVLRPSMYLY